MARDPWSAGSVPSAPSAIACSAIKDWFASTAECTLSRVWVIHKCPRLIYMTGTHIADQLIKGQPMSHEMCAVIMRRFGQIDATLNCDEPGLRWRKFMEPDFDTFAIADGELTTIRSIQ